MKNKLDYRVIEGVVASARHQRIVALGDFLVAGAKGSAQVAGEALAKLFGLGDRALHSFLMTSLGERKN